MRVFLLVLLAVLSCGCKRSAYLRTADRDAYGILAAKGHGPTWAVEPDFDIDPDTRSRFYDPTCPTDPALPMPAPQLYYYGVPDLVTPEAKPRDLSSRGQDQYEGRNQDDSNGPPGPETLPPGPEIIELEASGPALPMGSQGNVNPGPATVQIASLKPAPAGIRPDDGLIHTAQPLEASWQATSQGTLPPPVIAASAATPEATVGLASPILTAALQQDDAAALIEELPSQAADARQDAYAVQINPIPADAWESLPAACLTRMLEFDTVRAEYERTFKVPVTEALLDPSKRVGLENILELALINSRDYQTRKETLYRTALRLSLEQFQYDLHFLNSGNGTSLNYRHDRVAGIEVNRLGIPSGVGLTRALYTGGDFVARFANDVVLTFNGAGGYSSTIGSELLLDLSQPLLQRDVRFESLTQSERDVVYAARDFVQYRKQLFRDLSVRYYSLLLTYRSIAIDTQDYFSNLRGFKRAAAMEQVGEIPRFQVDQFEQNALSSRGNLVNTCNSLEGALDRLKLSIGLPTELPLNLDLTELEELTLRDEAAVVEEQVRRKLDYVDQQLKRLGPQVAITGAAEVVRRLQNLVDLNARIGQDAPELRDELTLLLLRLELEGIRIDVSDAAAELENLATEDTLQEGQIYARTSALIGSKLKSYEAELELLILIHRYQKLRSDEDAGPRMNTSNPPDSVDLIHQLAKASDRYRSIENEHTHLTSTTDNKRLIDFYPVAIQGLTRLQPELDALDLSIAAALRAADVELASTPAQLRELISIAVATCQASLQSNTQGLVPLEIDADEAMLTALVQRLDLMNRRDELADSWRDIKYAGDALRSVLDIEARQSIRTAPGSNQPFNLSLDDSTTTLGLQFDTPLNRRAQRNVFRLALINYNAALRTLIEAQDTVKLEIRDDMRSLELDRNQYEIAIASAALAYERVVSTRLQLISGRRNVSARDFLEAQQAYTRSLSAVARQHIAYIQDRVQFFLDLEQLQVDQLNYWPELRNEEYPFLANADFQAASPHAYGLLSCGPWYSRCIKRMLNVPPGVAASHKPPKPAAVNQPAAGIQPDGDNQPAEVQSRSNMDDPANIIVPSDIPPLKIEY